MIGRTIFIAILVCTAAPAYAADQKAKAASDQDDPIGRKLSERIGPYLGMVDITKHEMRDRELTEVRNEMVAVWRKQYEGLTLDEKTHYCVFQLRNESMLGMTGFWSDETYSKKPEESASRELIKFGRAAMPHLLIALDSRISTNSSPFSSRDFSHPWLVQDAAMDAVEHIACRLFGRSVGMFKLKGVEEEERQKILKKVAAWWGQNKGADEVQWAKDALLSETTANGESRSMAIDSLYHRIGKESYPLLVKAYHRLPKGRENADRFDETKQIKIQILHWLLKAPTKNEKAVFASAVQDSTLWVRLQGAEGLLAIGDSSGVEPMVKETEERLLKDSGSTWPDTEDCTLVSFLVRCNTPRSRETVYKCLNGRNPFLRQEAIDAVPSLRMEKAVRALPELLDDPFILVGGSYTWYRGNVARTVPMRRVCDLAAETFTKVVPDAPRFDGTTAVTLQASIDKMKQWWKENGSKLKWDEKRGMLVLPKKGVMK
jgi:hypothetical protein